MAYTVTHVTKYAVGNQFEHVCRISADAASGAFDSGLAYIEGMKGIVPESMATAAPKIKPNKNSGGTALNGSVFVSSAADGDVFYITLYGR